MRGWRFWEGTLVRWSSCQKLDYFCEYRFLVQYASFGYVVVNVCVHYSRTNILQVHQCIWRLPRLLHPSLSDEEHTKRDRVRRCDVTNFTNAEENFQLDRRYPDLFELFMWSVRRKVVRPRTVVRRLVSFIFARC